jgi:hypothetical protein
VSGLYLLKLQSVEDVGISERYPDSGRQWLWKWEVVRSLEADPDDEQLEAAGEVIYDYTKEWLGFTKNGQKSKSLARIDACLGTDTQPPDDDDEVELPIDDTDELVGKQIKAAVEVAPNTNGNLRAKLVTVGVYKKKAASASAKPARKAAPPPDDDDDDEDEGLPF